MLRVPEASYLFAYPGVFLPLAPRPSPLRVPYPQASGRFLHVVRVEHPVDFFAKASGKSLCHLHRTNHLAFAMALHGEVMQPFHRNGQCDPAVAILAFPTFRVEVSLILKRMPPKDALDFGGQYDLLFTAGR